MHGREAAWEVERPELEPNTSVWDTGVLSGNLATAVHSTAFWDDHFLKYKPIFPESEKKIKQTENNNLSSNIEIAVFLIF